MNQTSERTGVTVIRGLFAQETVDAMTEYINGRGKMLPWARDEEQFKRRYAHNVPFFVALHQQLKDYASEAFGEPLKPSYVFTSWYHDGGTCPLHIDRPQCYRTIDYLLTMDPPDHEWPIRIGRYMDDAEREVILSGEDGGHPNSEERIQAVIDGDTWTDVLLKPNDAVLYSGTNQWHYRPTSLPEGAQALLLFFHFVKESFDGPLA